MTELHFPLSASLIAKWFVARTSDDAERDLSNLKLQKLLFLAQSRYIHEHGFPLIKEDFEAWDHGPAVGVVYREYSIFRGSPVLVELADDGPWTRLPASAVAVLDQTWDEFGGYSAVKLRDITHKLGPWSSTYRPNVKHLVIPDDAIGLAWPEFASLAVKPVGGTEDGELRRTLDHFGAILAALPAQAPKGDPSFLLEELDSLEELRKHAASQLL